VTMQLTSVLWWDQLPEDLRSPLGKPLETSTTADVAIVGAGFTGLWTAYYLLQALPGIRIALVEKHVAGFGASGRNGGWASALFPVSDAQIARRFGLQTVHHMRRTLNAAVDEVGLVAAKHAWDIDWAKGGTIVAARSAAQMEMMQTQVRETQDKKLPENDTVLDRQQTRAIINATDLYGGLFTPHCASIQPAKLVRSLAQHVVENGVSLYEQTAAINLEPGVVRTHNGDVRARYVVRATEGYTPELPRHRRTLIPVYSLMVATEPLPKETWDEIGLNRRETFSDGRHLIIYGQRTADDRIAFGGRGAPYAFGSRLRTQNETDADVHRMLGETLIDLFPVIAKYRITHTWGGPLGIARDWWASVGLDPSTGLAWSGGYVGDGVVTSHLGGRTLAALISGDTSNPLLQLPWVNHHSRSWEPEPLRWSGITLSRYAVASADRVEAARGRPSRRAQLINRLVGH
jgi:glycine/D-amino acid oxidase-like deaminating enzyme